MRRSLAVFVIFFLPSQLVFASISISEVAWMGSVESTYHEWIELYNDDDSVSVDGWTLSDGVNFNITLVGTIPASSYVILERNRSDGGSVVGVPFMNYSGSLVNTGATLTLVHTDGSIVDSVAGGENWQNIGGDNVTKETAQYTTSGWITAPPTPGRSNATSGTTASSNTITTNSSGATIFAASSKDVTNKKPPSTKSFSLRINAPTFIYAGQPVTFSAVSSGVDPTIHKSVHYRWNFGDLHTSSKAKPTHTFTHPGTYNVVVDGDWSSYEAFDRVEVTVLPITVSLSYSPVGDILLHNDAMYEIDISGYYLTASKDIQIPTNTIISPRETITISWEMLGDSPSPITFLHERSKTVVTSTYARPKLREEDLAMITTAPAPVDLVANNSFQFENYSEIKDEENEALSVPSPFGFTAANNEEEIDIDDNEKFSANKLVMEDSNVDDSQNFTSILTATTTKNIPPTTWWTYIIFVLILVGSIVSLFYRPKSSRI